MFVAVRRVNVSGMPNEALEQWGVYCRPLGRWLPGPTTPDVCREMARMLNDAGGVLSADIRASQPSAAAATSPAARRADDLLRADQAAAACGYCVGEPELEDLRFYFGTQWRPSEVYAIRQRDDNQAMSATLHGIAAAKVDAGRQIDAYDYGRAQGLVEQFDRFATASYATELLHALGLQAIEVLRSIAGRGAA